MNEWMMSLINSKDKDTYLKLQVNQIKKLQSSRTTAHIYLHQGINIKLIDKMSLGAGA